MSRRDFLRLSALAALEAAFFPLRGSFAAAPTDAATTAFAGTDTDELAYLSAEKQISLFQAGTLSPLDVLEAQIARVAKYNGPLNTSGDEPADYRTWNGKVNAICYEHFTEARNAAKEAEKRYRAGTARALEGITVAVKDENDVQGWRVTMGSLLLKDAPVAEENSAIIDMLLAEGAVLHMQTTVPEFYMHGQTWSRLWGITRNPWNLHYAVGGSSGGSGAALAAGFTTLATGSDMGGSIRVPASQCGVYGFKPPFGRVPTSEISFETLGPMARTFGDLVLMQNAIAGPHPKVHASLRPKLVYPESYDNLRGVRIAVDYFASWIDAGIDGSVRKALADAVETLRSLGAVVDEVELGWRGENLFETFADGLLSTAMGDMLLQAGANPEQLTSYVSNSLETMQSKGPKEMALSDALTTKLHRQLQDEVYARGYQALVMPTLLTPYMQADNDPFADTVPVNGKPVAGAGYVVTYIWNLLSRYPVVDVPIGLADNRIPMGMQVVGNTFDDLAAFRVAHAYSQSGLPLYRRGGLFPDYRNQA